VVKVVSFQSGATLWSASISAKTSSAPGSGPTEPPSPDRQNSFRRRERRLRSSRSVTRFTFPPARVPGTRHEVPPTDLSFQLRTSSPVSAPASRFLPAALSGSLREARLRCVDAADAHTQNQSSSVPRRVRRGAGAQTPTAYQVPGAFAKPAASGEGGAYARTDANASIDKYKDETRICASHSLVDKFHSTEGAAHRRNRIFRSVDFPEKAPLSFLFFRTPRENQSKVAEFQLSARQKGRWQVKLSRPVS